MQIIERITELGFEYREKCSCGGTITETYKRKQLKIKLRPKKAKFAILVGKAVVVNWKPYEEFENLYNYVLTEFC